MFLVYAVAVGCSSLCKISSCTNSAALMAGGLEWLASGSDDTPTRAVPISLYPRDGELPCNISTSSSAFPPPSQELPGRGADWKGPWIRIDGTLHAPCATFGARCQIHLFKSCQEQRDVGISLRQCRCVLKIYQFDRFVVDCASVLHSESSCIAYQQKDAQTDVHSHQRPVMCDSCWLGANRTH